MGSLGEIHAATLHLSAAGFAGPAVPYMRWVKISALFAAAIFVGVLFLYAIDDMAELPLPRRYG